MTAISISTKIVQTPEILGNQPHIEGRRILVKDIVIWFESLGMSAEEIAKKYDLTLADVFSALAFYHLYKKTLRTKWDSEAEHVESMKKEGSTTKPSESHVPALKDRQAGTFKGFLVYMADDFDAPLEDFKDYM